MSGREALTPFAAMIDAKRELRELRARYRDPAAQWDSSDTERAEALREVIRAYADPTPESGDQAPTLAQLKDELERIEADAAERERAEIADRRERALAGWESRRRRMRDDADRMIAELAHDALEQRAVPPTGLADLLAATSDEVDRQVRAKIADVSIRPKSHNGDRIGELRRRIAGMEAEGIPTPFQARQERLAGQTADAPMSAAGRRKQ